MASLSSVSYTHLRSICMKNKKWIALAAAVVLAVTSLPVTAFAEKKDSTEIRCLQKSL